MEHESNFKNKRRAGFLTRFLCWYRGHTWTSAASEGIKPTHKQLNSGLAGFKDYATMYCKKCGEISKLSTQWKD